jgi:hypothetical protein
MIINIDKNKIAEKILLVDTIDQVAIWHIG